MPGLSVYCISFNFEGDLYIWDKERHCFVHELPNFIWRFNEVPPGTTNLKFSNHDPEEG